MSEDPSNRAMEQNPASTLVQSLNDYFKTGKTHPLAWRLEQLACIKNMLMEREGDFLKALREDLGLPPMEGYISAIGMVNAEINYTSKRLKGWMKPQRTGTSLVNLPGSSRILWEPLGVVLIIAPWNYPLHLILAPLVGVLAAGNCAVLKPSELSSKCAAVLARWIPKYLDPQAVRVVEGGVAETTALLRERFDHIFFTGGSAVGRIVMEAAAKNLTPVTMELGGKSPCMVAEDARMDVSVRRIAWGKFLNAGQTCVAPDFILVQKKREQEFLDTMVSTIKEFYGDDPRQSADFGRIINARHHGRITGLMKDGEVVVGGQADLKTLYIAPTVLRNVNSDSSLMQEEIFGPLLPVLTYEELDEALEFIKARPKPLALYVFTSDGETQRRVLEETSSGGVCINEVVSHLTVPGLPFGGVGASGMGAYHGRFSFELFSHRKAVLKRPTFLDIKLRYPPYGDEKLKWIRRLM